MAVLTEAIEAERGAGAATATDAALAATVTTTALGVTITVVEDVLVLALAPLVMTVTTVLQGVRGEMTVTMIGAVETVTVNAALVHGVVAGLQQNLNLPRMSVTDVPSLCSSWPLVSELKS